MDTRKYIFVNGVMKLNPAYKSSSNTQTTPTTVAAPNQALAIVSSTQDIAQATEAQFHATGQPMQLSEATTSSMEIMQDSDFLNRFQAPQPVDGGDVLDGLSNIFAKYEVPVGLVNKLLALTEYKLNFIVDDSGSMSNSSDALIAQASQQMKQKLDPHGSQVNNYNATMTRWQEAEDRLHIMIDMLAYIPTDVMTISFLNRSDKLILDHRGKTPEQFAQMAHSQVSQIFLKGPSGQTPVYHRLQESLSHATGATMHYLFTDGVPTDGSIDQIKKLVTGRNNPQMNPLTFMSCTNEDSEAEWMKEIEEVAPYTAELDDFEDEKREVLKDQGPSFPYSKGFWLLCQLVASINPTDLDAIDESVPFSKQTMDNLMGRKLTSEEYQTYFQTNPNSKKYSQLYSQFAREDISAAEILRNNGFPSPFNNQTQSHTTPVNQNQPPMFPNANATNQGYGNTGYNPGFWQQQQTQQQPQQQPAYQQQSQHQQQPPYPQQQQQPPYPQQQQQPSYPQQQQQPSYPQQQNQQQQSFTPSRPGFGR